MPVFLIKSLLRSVKKAFWQGPAGEVFPLKRIKYLLLLIACLSLCGCSVKLYNTLETVAVEAIKVESYDSPLNAESSMLSMGETDAEERFNIATDKKAYKGIAVEGMHLSPEDDNYIYEAAYISGNRTYLSEKEKQVLDAAAAVIDQFKGRSDYDIAAGVHDALAASIKYKQNEEQYTAYGALVGHEAICQGYAFAYKLCMDLAGIDCITIGGNAESETGLQKHAWNMVKIRNKWYHVDLTWDDPDLSTDHGAWSHVYLFADDEFMSENHEWDTIVQGLHGIKSIPKAYDASMHFLKKAGNWTYDQQGLINSFMNAYNAGHADMEIACEGCASSIDFIRNYCSCTYIRQQVGNVCVYYIMLK